jgi:hypothetical protein
LVGGELLATVAQGIECAPQGLTAGLGGKA